MIDLTELYIKHTRGELPGDDAEWSTVQQELRIIAVSVCSSTARASSRQGQLFGSVLEARIEDVYTVLLVKFIEKKLPFRGASIMPLLVTTARNELFTSFRRDRSPCTVCFDGAEETWHSEDRPWEDDEDLFALLRARLHTFRFPEYLYVREALLAFILSTKRYPGDHFLNSFGLPRDIRVTVYNAAIYQINTAIAEHFHESAVA